MVLPRVLVLESHIFQRSIIVAALGRLGVSDILQASAGEEALSLMRNQGGVDVAICDLDDKSVDCLEFLSCASQFGMIRAVALYSESTPDSHFVARQMTSLSGLELLGVLSKPVQLRPLQKVLRYYSTRCMSVSSIGKPPRKLPSESDIRRGLDLGEFRAYFQPKFALDTGVVVGAEVLARWVHPTKGLLLPKDFLAAILAYDLIDEMFKQLLAQGLSLLSVLRRQRQTLALAFNLHASQLRDEGLTEHIQRSLEEFGLPGSSLTFEVAENGLLSATSSTQENLLKLRILGCGLSVDDFGVGFSSLKLLCQLPFTEIKLDREFAENIQEPRSKAVVFSTQALAKSLNMSLVVEGISSQIEHQTLVDMGCKFGQGFYYAYPMTAHAMIAWLKTRYLSPT